MSGYPTLDGAPASRSAGTISTARSMLDFLARQKAILGECVLANSQAVRMTSA